MKCMWIGDSGTYCHVINDDTGMNDSIEIDESVQGSSGNVKGTQKCKLYAKLIQVDGSEILHNIWSVKYCEMASANLFSFNCKHLQGGKLSSNEKNNIVLDTTMENIALDCRIKTLED